MDNKYMDTDTEQTRMSRAKEVQHNVGNRINERVDSASTRVGDGLNSAAGGIRNGVETVATKLERAGGYLREHDARTMGSDLTNVIRNHPKAAIGVGLGLGFMIGRMLSR